MDLIEFLRARLVDEAALAEAAALTARTWASADTDADVPGIPGHRDVWVCDDESGADWPLAEMLNGSIVERQAAARHIVCWDPARVLAEVEAKRQVLEIHDMSHDPCDAHDGDFKSIPCETIEALAQPYANHPEFDPAWLATA